MQTRSCRACGAVIAFVAKEGGRPIPVNWPPVKVEVADGEVVARFVPHWATCTNPEAFRKER